MPNRGFCGAAGKGVVVGPGVGAGKGTGVAPRAGRVGGGVAVGAGALVWAGMCAAVAVGVVNWSWLAADGVGSRDDHG